MSSKKKAAAKKNVKTQGKGVSLKPITDAMDTVLPKLDAISGTSPKAKKAAERIREMKEEVTNDLCQTSMTIGA